MPPDDTLRRENFDRWRAAVRTGSAAQVAELYDCDASFLPTLSPELKRGRAAAEQYFTAFLQKAPAAELVEDCMQWLGADAYAHTGLYDFELTTGGKRDTVRARFTFLWARKNGAWRIAHHHSSLSPRA